MSDRIDDAYQCAACRAATRNDAKEKGTLDRLLKGKLSLPDPISAHKFHKGEFDKDGQIEPEAASHARKGEDK